MSSRHVVRVSPLVATFQILLLIVGIGIPTKGFCQDTTVADPADQCVVSILNRTATIRADGTWRINNIPVDLGLVRARITCIENGKIVRGETGFIDLEEDITNGFQATFEFEELNPIPVSVDIEAPNPLLSNIGATTQLSVTATLSNGSTRDVTSVVEGTNYQSSSPNVATVSEDGLVTAVGTGRALITAGHEGRLTGQLITVSTGADTDGDGISDELELELGLNPRDPLDALDDPDRDGLNNLREIELGTRLFQADSDGDFVFDGAEVSAGTNPLDAGSVDYTGLIEGIRVEPESLRLRINDILPGDVISKQLQVIGTIIGGDEVDLTPISTGTLYNSSNLLVANFGENDGEIFAGEPGGATITVSHSGHSQEVPVLVTRFTPEPLSFIELPGVGRGVDVIGDYAYVASSQGGLSIIDVSDPSDPQTVVNFDTSSSALRVKVDRGWAYVANSSRGLHIIDVSDPTQPTSISELRISGTTVDVDINNFFAYVVTDGGLSSELRIVDVGDPTQPTILGSIEGLPDQVIGVTVDPLTSIAAVMCRIDGTVTLVDVSVPEAPSILTSINTADPHHGVWHEGILLHADGNALQEGGGALIATRYDAFSQTATVLSESPPPAHLNDVVVYRDLALCSDTISANGIQTFDISDPTNPLPRLLLDFSEFGSSHPRGIDAQKGFVYVAGLAHLFIGQFLDLGSDLTQPLEVNIVSPKSGEVFLGGGLLPIDIQTNDDDIVDRVEIFLDETLVHVDSSPPFATNIRLPNLEATHTLWVRGVDIGGNPAPDLDSVTFDVLANDPPEVSFIQPIEGQAFLEGQEITVEVQAEDEHGIAGVTIISGLGVSRTITDPPYTATFVAPRNQDTFQFFARALDAVGVVSEDAEVTVTIQDDEAPDVTFFEPADGDTFIEGTTISVGIEATDNVRVTQVELRVDGNFAGTLNNPPYLFEVEAPVGVDQIELQASARDNLNQTTEATPISVNIIPDPLTEVIGKVVDGEGNALEGADLTTLGGRTGTSLADGTFSISGVPTIRGDIIVSASYEGGDTPLSGISSALAPVVGGVTDVGTFALRGSDPLIFSIIDRDVVGLPETAVAEDAELEGKQRTLYTSEFDGSNQRIVLPDALGVTGGDVDAFEYRSDGSIVFSVSAFASGAPGSALEAIDDGERASTLFRSTLDGSNEILFLGSELGMDVSAAGSNNIDAISFLPDESVLFSVGQGAAGVNGSGVQTLLDEDFFSVQGAVYRSIGNGTNEIFLEGPDILGNNFQDIDGLGWDSAGNIVLSVDSLSFFDPESQLPPGSGPLEELELEGDALILRSLGGGALELISRPGDVGMGVTQECLDGNIFEDSVCTTVDALFLNLPPAEAAGGAPPSVSILSPQSGLTLTEGSKFTLEIDVRDDVIVSSAEIDFDGTSVQLIPFPQKLIELEIRAPLTPGEVQLRVTATDTAGNTVNDSISLTLLAAPTTTISGDLIFQLDAPPLVGANLRVGRTNTEGETDEAVATGVANLQGEFSIPGVKILEDTASFFVIANGAENFGRSLRHEPVADGITDIGNLTVRTRPVVGYFDTVEGSGVDAQLQAIEIAGFQGVDLDDLTAESLENIDILSLQNPHTGEHPDTLTNHLASLHQWIADGGILVFHDRWVRNADLVLPGQAGDFTRSASGRQVSVDDATTSVTDGPGGLIDDDTLDNLDFRLTSRGYVDRDSIPAEGTSILIREAANRTILYSYPSGQGAVVYSTIPLSQFIGQLGGGALIENMSLIYAPNVLNYANDLR